MQKNKILESKHRKKIDSFIQRNCTVSMIREFLVIDGIDEFTLDEIKDYVLNFYNHVNKDAMLAYQQLKVELSSSYPLALINELDDEEKALGFQKLIDLDILRTEKIQQQLMAGDKIGFSIRDFNTLARLKTVLVKNAFVLADYKRAIDQANVVKDKLASIDYGELLHYIQNLPPDYQSVAQDIMVMISDQMFDRANTITLTPEPTQKLLKEIHEDEKEDTNS